MVFCFRVRAEKGIGWHIEASSVVWAFIDKGNQIARLAAIVVLILFSVRSVRLSIVGDERKTS